MQKKAKQQKLPDFQAKKRFPWHLLRKKTVWSAILIFAGILLCFAAAYASQQKYLAALEDEVAVMQSNYELELARVALQRDEYAVAQEETIGEKYTLLDEMQTQIDELQFEIEDLRAVDAQKALDLVTGTYDKIDAIADKAKEYEDKGVDVDDYQAAIDSWKDMLWDQDYDGIQESIAKEEKKLDDALAELERIQQEQLLAQQQAAQQQTPPPAPAPTGGGSSSSGNTAQTPVGTFSISMVKAPLGTQVKTLTANDNDCDNNCPAKSLAEYVSQVGGFAGIHGTYFCPPDYAYCADKVNSIFSSVYNSQLGKWIDWDKRTWYDRAGITFSGSSPAFYQYGGSVPASGITAGIVNYPPLLNNGAIVANDAFGGDLFEQGKVEYRRGR